MDADILLHRSRGIIKVPRLLRGRIENRRLRISPISSQVVTLNTPRVNEWNK